MNLKLKILAAISMIGLLFFLANWLINHGKNFEIQSQQTETIEAQKNVIDTKNFQQKIIANSGADSPSSRDKWLLLVWKKRTEANK